jgi:hypothetical protein
VLGGALTALVLVAALATWLLVRSDPYVAPEPPPAAASADPTAAAQLLRALEDAVDARDAGAAAELAAPAEPGADDLLEAVVANAEALHVTELSMRYVDAVSPPGADGRWQGAVDMTWRFDGFDREPVHEEVLVGFRTVAGEGDAAVGITSFGGGDRRTPLWLTGPLEVRRSERSLVLAATASSADVVARRADAAVPVVQAVLPQWSGGLVVEVPDSEGDLSASLAADPGTYDNVAAVTASVDGTLTPDSQVHVFVNPEVYDDLDPVGGQVVLSHEATHLATGAPLTGTVPLWLLEGFADYVALHDVDLPLSTTAGQIIAQVRREGAPDHLPGQTEFDAGATHLGAAYESAWLACVLLADAGGEEALVRLYEQVSHGAELGPRLRELFGLSEDELTDRWRQRLADLAAATTDGT